MGKKAKFKKFRKIASELPAITKASVVGEQVLGSELIANGVTEINGKKVNPKQFYRKKSTVRTPLDHTKHMKRLYNQQGEKGVQNYLNAVHDFVEYEQEQKKQESEKPIENENAS